MVLQCQLEASFPMTCSPYVYTDSQHQNPLSRVVPTQFIRNNASLEYDKEKYKEMLLDASETVLGIFGFDRTLFGKPRTRSGGCS